jgi:hypothetical protein
MENAMAITKEDARKPCKCCPNRGTLSVCRNAAIRNNWEIIKKLTLPGSKKKSTK